MRMVLQNGNDTAAGGPTSPEHDPDLGAASVACGEIRQALDRTLAHAVQGACDLRGGLSWSGSLEDFESLSMEMVGRLARFPIRTTDDRFGALVHRARAAVVAFRETVRREVVGAIDAAIDDAAYETAMKMVTARSVLASQSLESIEKAITQYRLHLAAAVADFDPALHGYDAARQ